MQRVSHGTVGQNKAKKKVEKKWIYKLNAWVLVRHFGAAYAIFYFHCQKCHVTEIYGRCHDAVSVSVSVSLTLSILPSSSGRWGCGGRVCELTPKNFGHVLCLCHRHNTTNLHINTEKYFWPIPNASHRIECDKQGPKILGVRLLASYQAQVRSVIYGRKYSWTRARARARAHLPVLFYFENR